MPLGAFARAIPSKRRVSVVPFSTGSLFNVVISGLNRDVRPVFVGLGVSGVFQQRYADGTVNPVKVAKPVFFDGRK